MKLWAPVTKPQEWWSWPHAWMRPGLACDSYPVRPLCNSQGFPLNIMPSRFPARLGTRLLATSKSQTDSSSQVRSDKGFFSFYRNLLEKPSDWLDLGHMPIPGPVTVASVPWLAHPGLCVCSLVHRDEYVKEKYSGQIKKGDTLPSSRASFQTTSWVVGK